MSQELQGTTFVEKMNDLYEQASLADVELGRILREVNARFTGQIVRPPLKRREDAEAKLRRGNANDPPESLKDIARATIKYGRLETMYSARDYLMYAHGGDVADKKDRYEVESATKSGYRDIKFFLKVKTSGTRRHICELQLNVAVALEGKELEHPIYEILRRAGSGAVARRVTIPLGEVQKLALKLRSVYVMIKKKGILQGADLRNLERITLSFFTDSSGKTPRSTSVAVEATDIVALQRMTPKIYRFYEQQAVNARVMTVEGLRSPMTLQQLESLK